ENDLLQPSQNSYSPSPMRNDAPKANFDLKALKAINRANAEKRPPLVFRLKSILAYLFSSTHFSFSMSGDNRMCKYNGHVRTLGVEGRYFVCALCGKTIENDDRLRASEPQLREPGNKTWSPTRAKSH